MNKEYNHFSGRGRSLCGMSMNLSPKMNLESCPACLEIQSLRTENRELREQAAAGARLAGQFEKIDALIHKDITDESLDTRKIIATSRHFRNMRDDITALAATKKDTQAKAGDNREICRNCNERTTPVDGHGCANCGY